MNTKKLIAQLLPSRAPTCYQDPQFNNLDKSDIAMALAHAPKISYYLIYWYLLQDKSAWRPLVDAATIQMQRLAKRKEWKLNNKQETIKRFTIIALLDWSGIRQCQQCGGSGIVDAVKTCTVCRGRGKLKFNPTEIAKLCGIKPDNWGRSSKKIYHEIMEEIKMLEMEAFKIIHSQLTLDKMIGLDVEFDHAPKLPPGAA